MDVGFRWRFLDTLYQTWVMYMLKVHDGAYDSFANEIMPARRVLHRSL
jgi:hypothetical protein